MKLKLIITSVTALVLCSLIACSRADRKPAGPPEKVTIAVATLPETALAQVAQSRGYYREEGLEATLHPHPYGKVALDEVLEGKADFATVAETPVMFAIMKGAKISVIATILTSKLGHAIVARKDRGITAFGDLKGKRIAATLGTTSQFFLDTFLVTRGISRRDVEVVDMKAENIADALASGAIDAASTFEPYDFIAQKRLGENLIVFHDKNIYTYNFNLVASQEFIRKNPGKVEKMLGSLVRAEDFLRANPAEAQKIVSNFIGMEPDMVRKVWADANFAVTLDQSLILALEEESRWAIMNRLASASKAPNYLDYIYLDGLKSVKPDAVRILR